VVRADEADHRDVNHHLTDCYDTAAVNDTVPCSHYEPDMGQSFHQGEDLSEKETRHFSVLDMTRVLFEFITAVVCYLCIIYAVIQCLAYVSNFIVNCVFFWRK